MSRIMKTLALFSVLLIAAAPAAGEEPMKDSGKLQVGDTAPQFELTGSDGKTHRLADHLGKRPVIIAWFPKAFTGG